MRGFIHDIEERTEHNSDFRRVVFTGPHLQLVLMTLDPGDDIGEEVHDDTDQFFRIEDGKGVVEVDGHASPIESGSAVVVPAGVRHNIRNTAHKPLRLYTIYAPPHHPPGTVHPTKFTAVTSEHQDASA
jgi:mannose-6-phosphate isomerase-like protein (cupin superfamily)